MGLTVDETDIQSLSMTDIRSAAVKKAHTHARQSQ